MCYMSPRKKRVGVRELRQNLSVYLRRVRAGQTLEVTDRGRPVAILAPLPPAATAIERLIASGLATGPVGDLVKLGMPKGPVSTRASEALEELRRERL